MFVPIALLVAGCGDAVMPGEGAQAAVPRRAAAATPVPAASLEAFWTRFRRAALAGDAATIRALSAPMVVQNSTLDDGPAGRIPASRVPAAVATVLGRPDGVDAAGRTHRAILQATPVPKRDAQQPAGSYRFGDLVFTRGKAGWRLTEIYMDE
ncbi:hypothetical protein NF699_10085 [Sphingomonadaceae bacterium OTU29LAMAA1]|nr:hypothetical protein NF699_10085 [Sphingomonadaceae bacterium OTU29LAMAA1]